MSKNLTGNKRIVKDACVDLYNAVQKWISSTSDSHATIVSMCLLRQKELSDEELSNQESLEDDSSLSTVSPEMLLLTSQLKIKLQNLESVVEKMKKVSKKFRSVKELSELESSHHRSLCESFESDSNTDIILFQQWPLTRFCEASNEITKMHLEELQMRLKLAEGLPILTHKSQLTVLETCWKYEPYIKRARINELLEATLCELELY